MLGLVLLVLFVHFGGSNVPKVLKDNKQMVYGVTIGLVLCSFFGVNVEGLDCSTYPEKTLTDKELSCMEKECFKGRPLTSMFPMILYDKWTGPRMKA